MPETTDLSDLIARVEGAGGPDRKLDTDIAIALRIGAESYPRRPLGSFKAGYVQADLGLGHGWSVGWDIPPITASIDAALALVERVLPGFERVEINYHPTLQRTGWVCMWSNEDSFHRAAAATPALAILSALLKSLSLETAR